MKKKLASNKGFTMLEVITAIVILGLIIGPLTTSLVVCHRVNAYADAVLQARLAVSAKVEQLMASGVTIYKDPSNPVPDGEYRIGEPKEEPVNGKRVVVAVENAVGSSGGIMDDCYSVTVTYKSDGDAYPADVSVTTTIRDKDVVISYG